MPTDRHLLTDDVLAARLKAFVQPHEAKVLARLIGCRVSTAENIRKGHWPQAKHWLGLLRAFGKDVTDAVFHPDAAIARLEQELRDLEQAQAAKRAALRDLAGSTPGGRQAPARLQAGAAVRAAEDPHF